MATPTEYQIKLGERLRAIRNQQGLTLQEVEERSGGRWKAVVVGSYERGDRAVSVSKLADLARFYKVPIADLLPDAAASREAPADAPRRLVLDLTRISDLQGPNGVFAALTRFAGRIQIERGDYNGRVLTIRSDDLRALSHAFDCDPEGLIEDLESQDAVVQPRR